MNTLTVTLTIVAALGSATFGGAMYAFSAFVMHGLDRDSHPLGRRGHAADQPVRPARRRWSW